MANTYTFKINAVDAHTQVGELEKVVYNVHWSYIGEDADGNSADLIGTQTVDEPNADSFTAFDDLVQADIIAWIEPLLDVDSLRSTLDSQLAELAAPTKVTLQVPESLAEEASAE